MNWQKITIWVINIIISITLIVVLIGIGSLIFAPDWFLDREVRIESPKLIIEEHLRYLPSDSINISPIKQEAESLELEISHASLKTDMSTLLKISSLWELTFASTFVLIEFFLYLASLWLLKSIVKSSNNPFTLENVKRLRILGAILIFSTLFLKVDGWYFSWEFHNHFELTGLKLEDSQDFDWTLFLAGLFMMIIAQVFNHGIKIREEQDLTI